MKPDATALRCSAIVIAFAATVLNCAAALASGKVALVVGNSAYRHVAHLANPTNDAREIGRAHV